MAVLIEKTAGDRLTIVRLKCDGCGRAGEPWYNVPAAPLCPGWVYQYEGQDNGCGFTVRRVHCPACAADRKGPR